MARRAFYANRLAQVHRQMQMVARRVRRKRLIVKILDFTQYKKAAER
jgi:hypothetical protein